MMVTNDYITVNGSGSGGFGKIEEDYIKRHHKHDVHDHQCSSSLVKHIKAPVHLVWSLVRRFDQPQKYKPFVSRCIVQGDLQIGSVREVNVKSGLPATTSTERLELLDDEEHIFGMRIVGGDHRLKCSIICRSSGTFPTLFQPLPQNCRTTRLLLRSIQRLSMADQEHW
ncbi:hypothetical protein CICLE_v10022206mg [Citrus x clementina]|uniref:Bet v I/Major latex protein domain-containing protein n=1 Tax=Citrus clementina TaxID=85681 RepID=V4TRS5_CITCL|nr:abscisic acid receptor PYL8 isoform X2 [Citrus x clementina]XP_015385147.2 abscisic acid receptor PYL8-like isoform X3 [Citrus sinensis]ESR52606.1 hypothetical protein CICLE_v10022206mg [Citrus x clementina]